MVPDYYSLWPAPQEPSPLQAINTSTDTNEQVQWLSLLHIILPKRLFHDLYFEQSKEENWNLYLWKYLHMLTLLGWLNHQYCIWSIGKWEDSIKLQWFWGPSEDGYHDIKLLLKKLLDDEISLVFFGGHLDVEKLVQQIMFSSWYCFLGCHPGLLVLTMSGWWSHFSARANSHLFRDCLDAFERDFWVCLNDLMG